MKSISIASHPRTAPVTEATEHAVVVTVALNGATVELWLRPEEARAAASGLVASAEAAERGEWQRGERDAINLRGT